jgi:hypothetical protein
MSLKFIFPKLENYEPLEIANDFIVPTIIRNQINIFPHDKDDVKIGLGDVYQVCFRYPSHLYR